MSFNYKNSVVATRRLKEFKFKLREKNLLYQFKQTNSSITITLYGRFVASYSNLYTRNRNLYGQAWIPYVIAKQDLPKVVAQQCIIDYCKNKSNEMCTVISDISAFYVKSIIIKLHDGAFI